MADSNVLGLTEKTDPVDGDWLYIVDVETDPDSDKKVSGANSRKWVIATAGSENQVATFDANGKLVGTALLTATASAVTIGNAAAATVQIGHASGGGTTVNGSATFNGALLSPGTGSNSFKAGPAAGDTYSANQCLIGAGTFTNAGTGAVGLIGASGDLAAIGGFTNNRVFLLAGSCSGTQNTQQGVFIGRNVTFGAGGGSGNQRGGVVVGSDTTMTGAYGTALGRNISVTHGGGWASGTDSYGNAAATAATNDFVLGVAAHNYKFPGTIITDLRFRTTTGTKIGTGTDQLIGFWNATPVDQPGNLTAAGADLGEVQTLANGIRSLLIEVGLMAPDP